jgi:2-alkyl-3-oxoalkanoate reductase
LSRYKFEKNWVKGNPHGGDPMKVFVTGASGFIGRAVVKKLIGHGHSVTALLLPQEPASAVAGASVVRGDVTQPETLGGKMAGHGAVIHLAGAVGYQTRKDCLRINKQGTLNVVHEAVHSGVRRFIHMSSVSVYGRVPNTPIGEDFPFKKIGDPYGDTKIEGENIVRVYADRGTLDLTILRPTAVYGEGDNKFLPKLVENLRSGKFRVIGDGEQSVDLVHVQDVAEFVRLVLEDRKSIGEVYNIANAHNPTWNEMLAVICAELGVPVPSKHLPYKLAYRIAGVMEVMSFFTRKPPRLNRYSIRLIGRQYTYLTDKARREMDFSPSTALLDGIRNYIKSTGG